MNKVATCNVKRVANRDGSTELSPDSAVPSVHSPAHCFHRCFNIDAAQKLKISDKLAVLHTNYPAPNNRRTETVSCENTGVFSS